MTQVRNYFNRRIAAGEIDLEEAVKDAVGMDFMPPKNFYTYSEPWNPLTWMASRRKDDEISLAATVPTAVSVTESVRDPLQDMLGGRGGDSSERPHGYPGLPTVDGHSLLGPRGVLLGIQGRLIPEFEIPTSLDLGEWL